jgi:hypothetical protein
LNIPTYLLGAIIFVIGQSITAIWWASALSSDVEALQKYTDKTIPALEAEAQQCALEIHNLKKLEHDRDLLAEAVKGLDVLAYRVESIEATIDRAFGKEMR